MLGSKIDAPNLVCEKTSPLLWSVFKKTPVHLMVAGVFLWPLSGCVMTKAQGEALTIQVRDLEDEVAKLQRVRHDMEVLLVGQVRDIIDRIARLEGQLTALRESLSEGSTRSTELVAEIQNLRGELEEAQQRYRNLEQDQKSLAKNQVALKEAQNKIRIPPLKDDHFALAKKYYLGGKFDEAILLFEQFVQDYPDEKELSGQSYYLLGEIYRKLGEAGKTTGETEKFYKKAVVSYQKIIEMYKASILREEALFKIGLVLKTMGNHQGAVAAFKELLSKHAKGKRATEAKKHLAALEGKAK